MVEERVSEVVYLVRRLGTRKMFKVHIERLKPYLTASGVRPPGSHDVEDLPPRPQPPPAAPAPAEPPQPRDPALPPVGAIIAGAQRSSPDLYLMKVRGLSNGRVTLTYLPRSAGFVGATDTFFAGAWLDAWEWWYPRDPKGDLADAEAECLLSCRKRRGSREFLVRWKGGGADDEWLPEAELRASCAALLGAYLGRADLLAEPLANHDAGVSPPR